jgi:hypothetical protein
MSSADIDCTSASSRQLLESHRAKTIKVSDFIFQHKTKTAPNSTRNSIDKF